MIFGYFLGGLFVFGWATVAFDGVHWLLAKSGWCKKGHPNGRLLRLGVELPAALLMISIFPVLPVFLGLSGLVARHLYELARPLQLPEGRIPAPRRGLFTDAAYHAMHRRFSDRLAL